MHSGVCFVVLAVVCVVLLVVLLALRISNALLSSQVCLSCSLTQSTLHCSSRASISDMPCRRISTMPSSCLVCELVSIARTPTLCASHACDGTDFHYAAAGVLCTQFWLRNRHICVRGCGRLLHLQHPHHWRRHLSTSSQCRAPAGSIPCCVASEQQPCWARFLIMNYLALNNERSA